MGKSQSFGSAWCFYSRSAIGRWSSILRRCLMSNQGRSWLPFRYGGRWHGCHCQLFGQTWTGVQSGRNGEPQSPWWIWAFCWIGEGEGWTPELVEHAENAELPSWRWHCTLWQSFCPLFERQEWRLQIQSRTDPNSVQAELAFGDFFWALDINFALLGRFKWVLGFDFLKLLRKVYSASSWVFSLRSSKYWGKTARAMFHIATAAKEWPFTSCDAAFEQLQNVGWGSVRACPFAFPPLLDWFWPGTGNRVGVWLKGRGAKHSKLRVPAVPLSGLQHPKGRPRDCRTHQGRCGRRTCASHLAGHTLHVHRPIESCRILHGNAPCTTSRQHRHSGPGPFRVFHWWCPWLQTLWLWTPTARLGSAGSLQKVLVQRWIESERGKVQQRSELYATSWLPPSITKEPIVLSLEGKWVESSTLLEVWLWIVKS